MFEDVAVQELVGVLADHDFGAVRAGTLDQRMGAEHVDAIVALERLIRFAQAGIAEHTVALEKCQRHAGAFVDDGQVTKSVIAEVAMARQMSNTGAQTQYAFAHGLAHMSHTARLLATGRISQRVAKAVVHEMSTLTTAQTRQVDAQLAEDLPHLTARRAAQAARRLVIAADPHAADTRATAARDGRHVNVTAAPDAMGCLSLQTTAAQAWACFGALDHHARSLKADGDTRTIAQIMADTVVERVTGQTHATDVPVEINILMRPETLLGDEDTPALLAGYGPLPPAIARQLTNSSRVWVRRLFTDPNDRTITARDPRRRRFDGPLGALIRAADQHCQQPWCDCRIIDIDHRIPHHLGGPTTRDNADGYCRRSHTTRHLPGWHVHRQRPQQTELTWQTPTGHTYTTHKPSPLGHGPHVLTPKTLPRRSALEHHLRLLIDTHGHRRQ